MVQYSNNINSNKKKEYIENIGNKVIKIQMKEDYYHPIYFNCEKINDIIFKKNHIYRIRIIKKDYKKDGSLIVSFGLTKNQTNEKNVKFSNCKYKKIQYFELQLKMCIDRFNIL